MAPGISDDDEPTVESLSRDKADLFSEHGLENTALGDAAEKIEDEKHDELTKYTEIVEAKVAVAKAREASVDDPAVEALAESVEELSEEAEAAALVEHAEEVEAREKISEFEALAGTTDGPAGKRFAEKAEALRSKHGLEEEPGRYEVEALEQTEDPDAEALQQFRDKQQQREADAEMNPEDQRLLANFKTMKAQANSPEVAELYQQKIEDLRAGYSE